MKLLFLFALMLGSACSLQMCIGPFKPPKFVELSAKPIYDQQNQMTEAQFIFKVKEPSGASLRLFWWKYRTEGGPLRSSKDNVDFRSKTKVSGGQYESQLQVKIDGNATTNIKDIARTILINLLVDNGCGSVKYNVRVLIVMQAIQANADLVTVTEMPRDRYFLYRGGQYSLRVGFTNGKGKPAPEVLNLFCLNQLQRRDGVLSFGSGVALNTTEKIDQMLGITEAGCLFTYDAVLESYFVSLGTTMKIDLSAVKEPEIYDSYEIRLFINLRRPGIKTPAIQLHSDSNDHVFTSKNGLIAPTRTDVTQTYCFADASNAPEITVARVGEDGDAQWLTRANTPTFMPNPSLGVGVYNIKSPKVGDGEEFICRARNGQDVVRQKFTVYRHEPVRVILEGYPVVRIKQGEHKSYNISCEATGVPQPDIRFFWSGKVVDTLSPTVADFLNETSDLFETGGLRTPEATFAWVVLKDVDAILENLPDNYWDENRIYSIACSAFNEITYADRKVATYGLGGSAAEDDGFNFYEYYENYFWGNLID